MKAVLGILAAIVVVGGGGWYLMNSKSGNDAMPMGASEEGAKGAGTFADLMMRAGSWKCTVTTTIEEAPSTGVVYVADGKVRADFVAKPAAMGGAEVSSSMIQADGFVYTWSDAMPQGMKMKVPTATDPAVSEMAPYDYTQKVDYDCGPWMADASVFAPPSDITFMELGENGVPSGMMPEGMPELPAGTPIPY